MQKIGRRNKRRAENSIDEANHLEARAADPDCKDDPNWLRRCAEARRVFADRRMKARLLKTEERRKNK